MSVPADARPRDQRLGLRGSLLWTVALVAMVAAGAVLLALALDPRTKEWWTVRLDDLAGLFRALTGR